MSKNLMPDIAKLLGVQIDEEFKLRVADQPLIQCKGDFCITTNNIIVRKENGDIWQPLETDAAYEILNGTLEVVRKPWQPKCGETYFTYFGTEFTIVSCAWQGFATQYSLLKNGCIFRTEEEAEQARPRLYKELTGRNWDKC